MTIWYKKRRIYKYTLAHPCVIQLQLHPEQDIATPFISLNRQGQLALAANYAWDGASGPMPDLPSVMRGALAHDALYQLMRDGHLDAQHYRQQADAVLRQLCLADGMNTLLAAWVYFCVRQFGARYAQSDLRAISNSHTPNGIERNINTNEAYRNIPLSK
ncbi:hypothetical protein NT239_02715 [Chitinibacter sp. SCUT-21]|uniref:hypothetical protein n=1 Tax=Chitinibacter sp. SCUT-21 TaxID=2970891 RepID=UPI0035A6BFD3